jgi:hypothetical protein
MRGISASRRNPSSAASSAVVGSHAPRGVRATRHAIALPTSLRTCSRGRGTAAPKSKDKGHGADNNDAVQATQERPLWRASHGVGARRAGECLRRQRALASGARHECGKWRRQVDPPRDRRPAVWPEGPPRSSRTGNILCGQQVRAGPFPPCLFGQARWGGPSRARVDGMTPVAFPVREIGVRHSGVAT